MLAQRRIDGRRERIDEERGNLRLDGPLWFLQIVVTIRETMIVVPMGSTVRSVDQRICCIYNFISRSYAVHGFLIATTD